MTGLSLFVVSCGLPSDDSASGTTVTTEAATTTMEPGTSTIEAPATPTETSVLDEAKLTQAAIRDLSRRLFVPEAEIEVIESKPVEWPDGSIGCPEEGQLYTQAIVEGWQVLLQANDRIYDYHAGSDGVVFLCPSGEEDGGYDFVPPSGND